MRRMYSQKQIENFAGIVVNRIIQSGINADYIGFIDFHNGYFLTTDEGAFSEINPANLDLEVKTLKTLQLNEVALTFNSPTNFSVSSVYTKMAILDHVIQIACVIAVENTTEGSLNMPSVFTSYFSLPDDVAKKIYDLDGKSVYEAPVSADTQIIIRTAQCACSTKNGLSFGRGGLKMVRYNNTCRLSFEDMTGSQIASGDTRYYYGEMTLTY